MAAISAVADRIGPGPGDRWGQSPPTLASPGPPCPGIFPQRLLHETPVPIIWPAPNLTRSPCGCFHAGCMWGLQPFARRSRAGWPRSIAIWPAKSRGGQEAQPLRGDVAEGAVRLRAAIRWTVGARGVRDIRRNGNGSAVERCGRISRASPDRTGGPHGPRRAGRASGQRVCFDAAWISGIMESVGKACPGACFRRACQPFACSRPAISFRNNPARSLS